MFETLEDMIVQTAESVRPPERLTVSQAATKYRRLNNPGSYVGPWDNSIAPYLVEVMDEQTSLDFKGEIFVGPARCGKSDIFFNFLSHTAICDPADMLLVHMTQASARDWSMGDLAKVFRHNPDLASKLIPGRQNDNVHDKYFLSGMRLLIKWPSITELSAKTIPRLWLMDYDRMDQDIDGEGSPFDLAKKRAQTFGRFGMTVAESSPGFLVENTRWIPQSRHEAPPTTGILALYNRGDRRRWYWRCVDCQNAFEPDFALLDYPKDAKDKMEAAEAATLVCPHCGSIYHHDGRDGKPGKHEMNRTRARWIKDGQMWAKNGAVVGTPVRSEIASFWLKGAAAAFMDWKGLVFNYLSAEEEYESTGSEEALKTTVTVDQGLPYTPKRERSDRVPEALKERAKDLGNRLVPMGVRFLIACVDVQKNRFVVQVHGVGLGGDTWIVDRFEIKKSKRLDDDNERLWVNPGSYLEDWKLLVKDVMLKSYELGDGSGRHMSVKVTLCDSGGSEGVTEKAYNFYRWLKKGPEDGEDDDSGWLPGLHARFQLIKGDPKPGVPRVKLSYPDSERKDRHAGARGEIPILSLNSTLLKDSVAAMLDRTEPGGGMITFPNWLPDSFYTELCVETKIKGKWENPKGYRNESWDLLYYCVAGTLSHHIRIERPNFWEDPPGWAAEWDDNDLVYLPEKDTTPFAAEKKPEYSLAQLARSLA